jgi:hypothetical protein
MAGIFTDVWRIVKPAPPKNGYVNSNPEDMKLYSNFSWYTRVMKGASSRFSKYHQYRNMDNDVFVARALDTIAEEMSSADLNTGLPFEIIYQNEVDEEVPEHIVTTLRAALRHWSDTQDLMRAMFDISRMTIKYGDCFFRKVSDFKKWQYIDPNDIIGVSINSDTGNIDFYQVRTGEKNKQGAYGDFELVPAAGIVHFSLSSNMGESGPFGESVLADVVKAYRHLSLLEDAVIIYRIVRAPERRVFMIDVGNMPPQRAKAYLESIKNEIRQKRVPNESGGQEKIDSVYNPISQTEDYFFMQTAEGRGSRVDTLSGGENLGEIADLNYFQNRFLQGLRIPSSYMRGSNDAGAQVQDGKVGVAYIEELRFANYVSRLQTKIINTFDKDFKAYLKSAGINISQQLFKLKLPDPQNFKDYKQAEVDEKLIQNYNNVKDIKTISKRFAKMRYLRWSEDDIQMNEAMIKQEQGIPDGGISPRLNELRMLYDDKWIENKPDIKVDPSYWDFTNDTKQSTAGEEPPEEPSEEPVDQEQADGVSANSDDSSPTDAGGAADNTDDNTNKKDQDEPAISKSIDDLDAAING